MCIICVSPSGTRLPDENTIRTMFINNPHGAGYMFARKGKVIIHKGFMNIDDYLNALNAEQLSNKDSVVYHFRISTQAGITPKMTQPFPLSNKLSNMEKLDLECGCGIAHNGIIRLTSDPTEKRYSDTALFITDYLTRLIRDEKDIRNRTTLNMISTLAGSKFAIMDSTGYVATVGRFITQNGLLFSNDSFLRYRF